VIPPLAFTYDGEALIPRAPKHTDQHYVVGEVYMLAPYEQRSTATHNHEFAWLAEAWRNLPEGLAELYPSPEHLRKRGLIEAGYYDETAVDAGSNAAALRVAATFRAREEFSLVIVRGPFVLIRTAKSQSRRAMDRATFQDSKSKLMEIVAGMIGVSPETLSREAGMAA
jgi:hypothetical protein